MKFQKGVEKVERQAFEKNKLNSIVFPSTIKTIEKFVIENNPVETIIINAITPPKISRESFAYRSFDNFPRNPINPYAVFNENLKIYVPAQSVEAYKTSKDWRKYAQHIVVQ